MQLMLCFTFESSREEEEEEEADCETEVRLEVLSIAGEDAKRVMRSRSRRRLDRPLVGSFRSAWPQKGFEGNGV